MKFSRFLHVVLLSSALMIGTLALVVHAVNAAEIRTRDTTISEDEYIDDDLFIFGDEIEIEGTVTGDLVAMGGSVVVTGSVGGNAYLSGGEVIVSGEVGKSLFMGGGRLKVSGVVERSLYMGGGQLILASEAYVMEDMLAGGGQMDVDGWIGDDLWASGGTLDIGAVVDDDLYVSGGVVRAEEENVGGDYKVNVSEEGDDWSWEGDTFSKAREAAQRSLYAGIFTRTLWFIGMLFVGAVFIRFIPVKTMDIVNKISMDVGEFMWSLAIGLIVSSALPLAVIVLAVTVLGAPLAVLLTGLALFLIFFGSLWGDMAIGGLLTKWLGYKGTDLYVPLVAGRIVRVIIGLIPCVGGLYGLVLSWVVVGAAVRAKFERVKAAEEKTKENSRGKGKK